jgi:deoxyguanosine kinase
VNAPYYIAIEGVIGVGKTSLARLVAEKINGKPLLEQAEENPYLADFYRDPRRYAFQIQLFFLLNRYRQLLDLPQQDLFHRYLIADYIFAKDRIFAALNLEKRDLILYDRVATLMEKELPKPDLVIYLQSTTERLLSNIRSRKVDFEKSITADYIRQINEAYNDYFFRYVETPLLVINTTEIDFVRNEEDLNDLVHQVLNPPLGVKYYVPRKK